MTVGSNSPDLPYQVDEKVPLPLLAGTGMQHAALSLMSTILTPTVAFRAAGAADATLVWAIFASLFVSGATVALHARPIGRFGSGYVMAVGPTSAAIAVTVDALKLGGPALLSLLVITAAAVQYLCALRMSLLRRVLSPTISGTALMLIPVMVMPVAFDMFDAVPVDASETAGAACAGVTILAIAGVTLRGTPLLRSWAPVCGIVLGSIVGAFYGLDDIDRFTNAPWFGTPAIWPTHFSSAFADIDVEAFVALAPAFVLVFLICTIRSMSSSLGIQTISWRGRRAMDFRSVQSTIAADALSNLASGLAGTMPNSANSSSVARIQLTGIAARPVGLVYGSILMLLAFCPKVVALVLAVPAPVFAGYVTVMLASIFMVGAKMIVSEGSDSREAIIAGLAFIAGVGCQYGFIFPDFVATFAGGLLKNALTSGLLIAILLTALILLTAPRAHRLETRLGVSSLPELREFMQELAAACKWESTMATRFDAVGEEALLTLLRGEQDTDDLSRRLLVVGYRDGNDAVFEFIAAGGQENIEDRLAVLEESAPEGSVERDVSLRLLRHLASDVRHRQYYDVDILTVRIANSG